MSGLQAAVFLVSFALTCLLLLQEVGHPRPTRPHSSVSVWSQHRPAATPASSEVPAGTCTPRAGSLWGVRTMFHAAHPTHEAHMLVEPQSA